MWTGASSCSVRCSGGVGLDAQTATPLQGAPLVLTHPTPHAGILPGFQSPLQARLGNGATPAHRFGLLDLEHGRSGGADREEQLRVLVAADGTMAPVHEGNTPQISIVAYRWLYVRRVPPPGTPR